MLANLDIFHHQVTDGDVKGCLLTNAYVYDPFRMFILVYVHLNLDVIE